ncbi:TRAP transporter small permease [Caenimonas soli]|uniref:TRAP transporter small permease n=1 Tax=Caenimonas soli TaxID=2735555 RepID=UPI001552A8B5|nr:TRAP transporter small permease [Caenimonas soli]NPC54983.1 TRAP transporter small permease [Caenimonas soli]
MPRQRPGPVLRTLEAVGAACLVILMVTVFVDVVGRNLLNMPLPWGTEVLEIVLAAMIFVLYPVLALTFGHITVDLIKMPVALQRFQRALGAGMGAALFALIAWCLVRQTLRAAEYGEKTALLGVPISVLLGGMAVLAAVTAFAFMAASARAVVTAPPPPEPLPEMI